MTEKTANSAMRRFLPLSFDGLWREPEFMKLWIGQTVSEFGSWLGALGLLAILVLDATPAQMGLLETLRSAPALIVGLFAGVWVDRLRRRPLLIGADLGRGVLLGIVAIAALMGVLRMEALYVVAFLIGSLTIFFNVAYRSYVPGLVRRDQLVEANSKIGASTSLAEIASPGLGGLLVQLISAPLTLLLDAMSFFISAVFVGRIRTPEPAPVETAQSVRQDIGEGLRLLWRRPLLRALALTSGTRNFFGGFFAALYGLFVIRELGLSPAVLGLLIGSGGIGALAGATVASRMTGRLGAGRTLILSSFSSALLALLVPLASGPAVLAAFILLLSQIVGDFALSIYFINELSLRQLATPGSLLGRVNASFEFIVGGVGTTGILVGGLLGQSIGLRAALAVAAVGTLFACLWLLVSPVRSLQGID